MPTTLSEMPIQFIKGVGPARAKSLAQLGIHTVEDLLYFFHYRYEDRREFTPIAAVKPGEWHTLCAQVLAGGVRRSFNTGQPIVEAALGDASGRIMAVWFNQPYLAHFFKPGMKVVLYGRVDLYRNRLQIVSPDFERVDEGDNSLNMGRIVPIYSTIRGVGQRYLRQIIHTCLDRHAHSLEDVLPKLVRDNAALEPIAQSINQLHFPDDFQSQSRGNDRIAFEEFFLFQISVLLRRRTIVQQPGFSHEFPIDFFKSVTAALPFPLTKAQDRAVKDILGDMAVNRPMLRLIQGDVGSGKTVVAFIGCLAAISCAHQAALMAPTEILAQQHYGNFLRLFKDGAFGGVNAALLISSLSKKEKQAVVDGLKQGSIHLVIGTHALLEDMVQFKDLSFVVIDEQHKFGVNQRALLSAKTQGAKNPDVLVMTATPIPRTLCLTLYGDLDVTVIDELPPGRGHVKTYHFPSDKALLVYQRVREWVLKGTQAYIIYPLVEESEKLNLKAALGMFEHLSQGVLKGLTVALVHGQMPKKETDVIMQSFKRGEIQVLVATTILEVGIDVANANVMVIEHAERFGLSQLHQLRGRIGRGEHNGVCILVGDPTTEEGVARLDALVKTTDGFKIAQRDLEIRGPGHYFGRFQHGFNELRVANPITQLTILEKARKEAISLIESDPDLKTSDHGLIKPTIKKRYPMYLDLLQAG